MSTEKTLLDEMAKESVSLAEILGMEEVTETVDLNQMRAKAESGDQTSIQLLGIKYLLGDGVEKDPIEAMYWLEKSTSATAKHSMGRYYQQVGEFELAEKYFLEEAADPSNAYQAYESLAYLFMGQDSLNLDKAEQYLEKACALSSEENGFLMKLCKYLGRLFGESKQEKTVYWLKKALQYQEDEEARKRLELAYGSIVKAEESPQELRKEAMSYLEQQGERVSLVGAADMFLYYFAHREDVKKFYRWSVIAAEKGFGPAQIQLAYEYIGKKYTNSAVMDLEMDLKASERYLAMAEKDETLVENIKKHIPFIQKLQKKVEEELKKQSEKHLTEEIGTELLNEAEKAGSTVLRIPDGYTHIDGEAMGIGNKKNAYIKKITEVVFPDSIRVIGYKAFEGCCNLTKIVLPKNLERFDGGAFDGTTKGFLGREVKDKRTIEKLVIPGTTKIYANLIYLSSGLTGIHRIKELYFEEGQTEIDCTAFYDIKIDYLYLPDSVVKLTNCEPLMFTKATLISAPSHLQGELKRLREGFTREIVKFR